MSTKKAFTLVELLVVIAIISVLAAMLLPALSNAREMARTIQCVNNHRQLAMGVQLFADNNNGRAPGGGKELWGSSFWWDKVMNNLVFESSLVRLYAVNGLVQNSFMCPKAGYLKGTYSRVQVMNRNVSKKARMVSDELTPSFCLAGEYYLGEKLSSFRNPSRKFLVVDAEGGNHTGGNAWPGTMTYNITSYGTLKGGTSSLIFRHGPQGSLSRLKVAASCIDGHVAAFDFEEDMNTGARWSAKD